MRTATIILSVLLAIAIGSGITLYSRYTAKNDALLESETMLTEAEKNVDRLNERMSDLNRRIKARSAAAGILRKKLVNADETAARLKGKIHNLETRTRALTAEIEAGKVEKAALGGQAAMAGDLRKKLSESNETAARLKQTVLDLEARMKALTALVASEKKEKAALKTEAAEADDLRERLAEANEDVDRLKRRVSELEGRMRALTAQVASEKKEKAALRTEAAVADDLQEKLAEANEDVDRLKRRISDLEDRMKVLSVQVAAEKKAKEALEARVVASAGYREQLEKLGKDLEKARETGEDLSRELKSRDEMLAGLKEKIVQLESDLEETDSAYDTLAGESALKDEKIADLEAEVAKIRSHLPYLKLELKKEKDQIKGMRNRVAGLIDERVKADVEMQQMQSTYDALISDLKKQINSQEVNIEKFKKKISVSFVDRILFDFGKASISTKGKEILGKVGRTLKAVHDKRIRVVGHTDNVHIKEEYRYKFPSNWELSAARAAAVVRYLQDKAGVEPGTLEAVGRSFYEPVADNGSRRGRARNRRVQIVIAPHL